MIKFKHSWHWWAGRYGVLALIVLLGAWLRLYRLGELPRGLNRDEAAIAYNAWLLARTGQDEWQRVWPVFLESFGDQKLPGYPYLTAALFAARLDAWLPGDALVRLPGALAGVGTIIIVYLLIHLFGKKKTTYCSALLGALAVSVNPIFIWYSRGAWEANLALFWLLLAVYLICRHYVMLKKWTVSSLVGIYLLLQISFLTYNAPLLIMSVMAALLVWLGWRRGVSFWGPLLASVGTAVVVSYGLLLPVTAQKNGIVIFSDPTVQFNYAQYRLGLPGWLRPFLGSQYVYWALLLGRNTLASVAPKFWLHSGSHPWHQLPGFGLLHVSSMLLIYLALLVLLGCLLAALGRRQWRQVLTSSELKLAVIVLVALVPSVITTDSPHATRSLEFFVALIVMAALVLGQLFGRIARRLTPVRIVIAAIVVVQLVETGIYAWQYRTLLTAHNIYHQEMEKVFVDLDTTQPILVRSSEFPYEYIKFAWMLRIEPELFWSTLVRREADAAGIKAGSDLLNFHFVDDDDENYAQVIWYNQQQERWEKQR